MVMLNVLHLLRKVRKTPSFLISTRSFLSEAFNLNEAWDNRLNSPTIKKINLEALYYELDSQYSRTRKLSAVDVDIFINGLTDETYITEAEELIYRLRTTAETHSTLPTTHHAVIRLFMSTNQVDTLMRILNDRLNYGIFPDDYCYLYMMNHFLKRKDYKNAAKIASLPMLQEDFSHPLVRQFSLYSTYNYLLNRSSWEEQTVIEEKTEEEDDEEEIKIRVKYIRNPFFDDHFDLTDPNHICGKILYMIGNRFTDAVGRSYCIMGLALYNKWEKLDKYLNGLVQSKEGSPIYSECIGFTENVLNEKCSNDLNINIKEKISQLPTVNGGEQCLIKLVEDDLKHLVQQLEPQEIEEQKQKYSEWEALRDAKLEQYLIELDKINRLQTIQVQKDELAKKEQLLYYFDNEEEIKLIVEKKTATLRKRAEGVEKRKKSSSIIEDVYVPPEVKKRETIKD